MMNTVYNNRRARGADTFSGSVRPGGIRHPLARASLLLAVVSLMSVGVSAQRYSKGEVVQDFTLIDRSTGSQVRLYDLEGKVIFLEWFAYWCPFCQAAASALGPDVVDYFEDAGGNENGVEVVHVAVNLQGGQEVQTQAFIDRYGLGIVWNDFTRTVARRFGSNQPIFAVINGVADSTSHRQWELIFVQNGYGQLSFPIQTFRQAINSVEAAAPDEAPAILLPPVTRQVPPGQVATLSVSATGDNLVFQWSRNGSPIVGAEGATLEIPSVSSTDAGAYSVDVSNATGRVVSQTAFLGVGAVDAPTVELANVSTRLGVGTGSQILVAGFVLEGTNPGRVLIRGVGPALAGFGLAGVLEDPLLKLFRGESEFAVNDNWGLQPDSVAVRNHWLGAGAFDLAGESLDSALYQVLDEGPYSAQIRGVGQTSGIGLVEVYNVGDSDAGLLANISTRGSIVGDTGIMIMGFVLLGESPREVLVRAIGPTLGEFGLSDALGDPELKLYRNQDLIAQNDQWAAIQADAITTAFGQVGAFSLEPESADSAILIGLPPGRYTAHVSGVADAAGVVLAEVYVLPRP